MPRTTAGLLVLALAGPAAAQGFGNPYGYGGYGQGYGGVPPGGFAPNFYNRQTQPLSPYLNLLNRGNQPGVNYFYGVRPGLPSGGLTPLGTLPQYPVPVGPAAGGFLPQSQIPYDPNLPDWEPGGRPVQLRSAGHPLFYGNQFAGHGSYQSVYFFNAVNRTGFLPGGGQRAGGQTGIGGQRPALGGLGSTGSTTPPRTR